MSLDDLENLFYGKTPPNDVDVQAALRPWKNPVRVATTAAGTLATSFAAGQVVDGVTLAEGDRILLKNQASGIENGLYNVSATGAPSRSSDLENTVDAAMIFVPVVEGTTNGETVWYCSDASGDADVGTDALTFANWEGGSSSVTSITMSDGFPLVGQLLWEWNGTDTSQFDTTAIPFERDVGTTTPNAATELSLSVVAGDESLGNMLRVSSTSSLDGGGFFPITSTELTLPVEYVVYCVFGGHTETGGGTLFPQVMLCSMDTGTDFQGIATEGSRTGASTQSIECYADGRAYNSAYGATSGVFDAEAIRGGGKRQLVYVHRPDGEDGGAYARVGIREWGGNSNYFRFEEKAIDDFSSQATISAAWDAVAYNFNRLPGPGMQVSSDLADNEGSIDIADLKIFAKPAGSFTQSLTAVVDAGGTIDHGTLAGTSDDDHTLYSLADGSRGVAQDGTFRIQDTGDTTKQLAFDVGAISTATTRTVTVPDANVSLTGLYHSVTADEFSSVAEKATPVSGDRLLLEDSADSYNKKFVQVGNLPSGGGGGGDSITVNGAAATDADFDNADPAAPAGDLNVLWQINTATSPDSVSAYVDVSALEPLVNHDNLTGFVANEHLDWTADQGATDIHAGNVPDGADATAIHDNVAGEINALTTVTPVAGDQIVIEDASDSFNKKKVDASNFLGGGGAVTSVFTRTGAVVAATSDYDAIQVDFTADGDITSTNVQAAIVEVRDDTDTKIANMVTAASTFTGANRVLVAGGADRTSDDSGVSIDGSNNVTGVVALTATGDVDTTGYITGLLEPVDNSSTSITVADSMRGQALYLTGTSAITVTIPHTVSTGLVLGLVRDTAQTVTLATSGGITLTYNTTDFTNTLVRNELCVIHVRLTGASGTVFAFGGLDLAP